MFRVLWGVDSGVPACNRVGCCYVELIDLIYHFYRWPKEDKEKAIFMAVFGETGQNINFKKN